MLINSNNDWDTLEEIIVGDPLFSNMPNANLSTRNMFFASKQLDDIQKISGPHDDMIIKEAKEDIESFCELLKSHKIKVHRPNLTNFRKEIETPFWKDTQYNVFNPRDLLLPLSEKIIECSSPCRGRYFETLMYRDILIEAFKDGTDWVAVPRPILSDDNYDFSDLNTPTLMNNEILFDAANIIRLGRDILYQLSNTGNLLGFLWLKKHLKNYRVHLLENIYSGAHIDSTIIPLKPGMVLLNGKRCNFNNYPKIFEKWEKIFFDDFVPTSIGNESSLCSDGLAINILNIDEKILIVEETQINLIKLLRGMKFDVIPVRLRHGKILGGSFHCVTLDIVRKGDLNDYF